MRAIDADALYEKTAEWEAQAEAQIEKLISKPVEEMTSHEYAEWKRWTYIMNERTAFKHDIADAPTIEAEPKKPVRWIKNGDRYCECPVCHHEGNISGHDNYCWYCGEHMMDEVEE